MPGSIRKRGAHSWQLIVCDGYDMEGKKKTYTRTLRFGPHMTELAQRRAADKAMAEFYVEVKEGRIISGKQITFAAFAEMWLKNHVEPNLTPKTLYEYRKQLRPILDAFGHTKLQQITSSHIHRLYRKLFDSGLAGNSVHAHHRLLSALFGKAVKWGYLAISPMLRVDSPKKEKQEPLVFDSSTTQKLLAALEDEPEKYKCFILLDIATGLRSGELLGLRWRDIDFERFELSVRQMQQYIPGQRVISKAPKRDSTRIVAFPPRVGQALLDLKKAQAIEALQTENWIDSDSVFTQKNGEPMFPTSPSQWFRKFLKRHNLPHMRLHDLRHLHASLLIAQGVDPVTVAKRLGHASTNTTLNLYAHALRDKDKAASDCMAAIMFEE